MDGPKAKWPVAKITGGPHGKNAKLEIDGVEKRVHRVEVVIDVNDAVRVTTYQTLSAAIEVDLPPGQPEDGGYKITVRLPEVTGSGESFRADWTTVAAGEGATIR